MILDQKTPVFWTHQNNSRKACRGHWYGGKFVKIIPWPELWGFQVRTKNTQFGTFLISENSPCAISKQKNLSLCLARLLRWYWAWPGTWIAWVISLSDNCVHWRWKSLPWPLFITFYKLRRVSHAWLKLILQFLDVMTEIHHSFVQQNASSIRSTLINATPRQAFITHPALSQVH